jgi:hypothetical protein
MQYLEFGHYFNAGTTLPFKQDEVARQATNEKPTGLQ